MNNMLINHGLTRLIARARKLNMIELQNITISSLSLDELFRVLQRAYAKEMWDNLEVTHEGTSNVKRVRKHALI